MKKKSDKPSIFQTNLKYYRQQAGFKTAQDFADAYGISYTKYLSYETRGVEPPYDMLVYLADALSVSIDALLGRPEISFEKCRAMVSKAGYQVKALPDGLQSEQACCRVYLIRRPSFQELFQSGDFFISKADFILVTEYAFRQFMNDNQANWRRCLMETYALFHDKISPNTAHVDRPGGEERS